MYYQYDLSNYLPFSLFWWFCSVDFTGVCWSLAGLPNILSPVSSLFLGGGFWDVAGPKMLFDGGCGAIFLCVCSGGLSEPKILLSPPPGGRSTLQEDNKFSTTTKT